MSYPYLCATSHEMHRGGFADIYRPRSVAETAVIDIEVTSLYVADHWWTWDRTIIDDERPGWDGTPPGLAELVLEIAS